MEPDILIPPAQAKEMLSLPDEVLSSEAAHNDDMQSVYTLLHPQIVSNQWHTLAIKALSALAPRHIGELSEEVSTGIEAYLGTSNSWEEVSVLPSMIKVAARCTNRFVLGSPLCKLQDVYRRRS